MKRLAFAAVGLALVAVASACGGGNGDDEGREGHYENAKLAFAFDYADHWEQIKFPIEMTEQVGEIETLASVMVGPAGRGGGCRIWPLRRLFGLSDRVGERED